MHSKDSKTCTLFLTIMAAIIVIMFFQYRNVIGYLYPMKYKNFIIKYSKTYELDPYLVSGVINVESKYNPKAKSHKDAKGLMQITPSTGRWVAERMGIENFSEDMLFDPETNIKMGCWYLNNLRQEFAQGGGVTDIVLVLAAYNGGSGNVRKWLKDDKYSQTGASLDQIPFNETQQYVEKVIKNEKIYRWLYPGL